MKKVYYLVYKTTNKINGKFYIGTHKTKDLNDDYLGSGMLLRRAIKKYGIENFQREILYMFDNSREMFVKEAEIVTLDFLAEQNTYNLRIGGEGGFDYLNTTGKNWKHKNRTGSNKNLIKGRGLRKAQNQQLQLNFDQMNIRCTNCDKQISYQQFMYRRKNRDGNWFCNHSCSATYNNKLRRAL